MKATKKATSPQTRIVKVSVQQVEVGKLSAGPMSIQKHRVVAAGMHGTALANPIP